MLPELPFMKGYRTVCVSIVELQINYKVSFKEAVSQLKVKKMKRKAYDEKFFLLGFKEIKSDRKISPPKTPFRTICKLAQNFGITPPLSLWMP